MPPVRAAASVGVLACGVVGLLVAGAGTETPRTFHTVGAAAFLAAALAVLGITQRGWTRLPLAAAAVCAGATGQDAFFGDRDPSMLSPLIGYVLINGLIIALAAAALAMAAGDMFRRCHGNNSR